MRIGALDPNGVSQSCDTTDLLHCVCSLSHFDLFLSADRWAMDCALSLLAKGASAKFGVKTATPVGSNDDLELAFDGT
ncbi:hypothetical protein BZG29_17045 [Janthinobacterium sp. LM6]|nr:hypothetical protein BZG29_17045 [Janthinobacterium sp. LM6]